MRLNKIADKNCFLLSFVSKKYEIKMLEEDQNLIGKESEENLWQVNARQLHDLKLIGHQDGSELLKAQC